MEDDPVTVEGVGSKPPKIMLRRLLLFEVVLLLVVANRDDDEERYDPTDAGADADADAAAAAVKHTPNFSTHSLSNLRWYNVH